MVDDDDFDPDAGFNTKTTSSDDRWEGEDLDLAEVIVSIYHIAGWILY
jgi:hypothetical protein